MSAQRSSRFNNRRAAECRGCVRTVALVLLLLPRVVDAMSVEPYSCEVEPGTLIVSEGRIAEALFVAEQILHNNGFRVERRTFRTVSEVNEFEFQFVLEERAIGSATFSSSVGSGQLFFAKAQFQEWKLGSFKTPESFQEFALEFVEQISRTLGEHLR